MKILIDMQACQNGSRFRGIGRYATGIVTEILKQAQPKHECHLLLNGMFHENVDQLIGYFSDYVSQENIHIWSGVAPAVGKDDNNIYRIKVSEVLRDAYLQNLSPDLVFMPTFFEGYDDDSILTTKQFFDQSNCLLVSTCHDLIPLVQSDIYLTGEHFRNFYLNQVQDFTKSDGFLAVSESSMMELHQKTGVSLDKIVNTLEGVESKFSRASADLNKLEQLLKIKNIVQKKIILYSGASDERKNHLKLIKAFSMLPLSIRKDCLLVFAGGMPGIHMENFREYASKCKVSSKELIMPGRLSDEEMINLYRGCYIFIFPSFHEGFGLPALEAMACGAPVLASNTTSLPEVVGREDLLFNPYSEQSIHDKLVEFLTNEELRDEAAIYCYDRSKEFTWEKSASIAIKFFEKLYEKRHNKVSHLGKVNQTQLISKLFELQLVEHLSPYDKEKLAWAVIKNYRKPRTHSRLYIDLSVLMRVDFVSGIQRVTMELYNHIVANYSDKFEIIPVEYKPQDGTIVEVTHADYARAPSDVLSYDDLLDFSNKDIFLGLDLNYDIAGLGGVIDRMKRRGCKVYFLVHDLLPLKLGVHFFDDKVAQLQFNWLKQLIKSDGIITISRSVMYDIKHYLDMFNGYIVEPFSENNYKIYNQAVKLAWSHHGANFNSKINEVQNISTKAFDDIDFSLPSFLMVGSIEPRKGHLDVIKAFDELWQQGQKVNLIIVARIHWGTEETINLILSHPMFERNLFWLQDVDDEELAYLYDNSQALIAASIDEGFGLPIIEALHFGIDVVCRDIPIFREVGSNLVRYFNTVEELKDIITNNNFNNNKVKPQLLSWEQSAENLMNIILRDGFVDSWSFSDQHYLMPVFNEKFGSRDGEKSWDSIKTLSQEGLLLFGGWLDLEAGVYEFKLLGRSEKMQNIDFSAVQVVNNVEKKLAWIPNLNVKKSSTIDIISEEIACGTFKLSESYKGVEFYIEVKEQNTFSLSYIELTKLD